MAHSVKYKVTCYEGGRYPWFRRFRHAQRLREFYAAKAERRPHRGIPDAIREGAWADEYIDMPWGEMGRFYHGQSPNHAQEFVDMLRTRKRRHVARRKARKAKMQLREKYF